MKSPIISYRRMMESGGSGEGEALSERCRKWYRLQRKARREPVWLQLFEDLFRIIFPEIPYGQLLISAPDMFEHFQLFFNVCVTCHDRPQGELIQENPGGLLEHVSPQGVRYEWKTGQPVAFARAGQIKSERIAIRVAQSSSFLRIDRKLMEKFKNDILRQDRETKEGFLSSFLFCNFTPVYYITNIHVISVKENHEVELKPGFIYLLYQGVVRRKNKTKTFDGTELTKGCIINCKLLSNLLEKKELFCEEECYETKVDSIVLSFELEEMVRILKLNPNLKKLLEGKLKTIAQERLDLSKKSTEILEKFSERLKMENESVQIHYSVQFKTRNVKSAQAARSFRCMRVMENSECNYGQFITFDKYDKMIESKERVALTKHSYVSREKKRRERPVYTPDYEKKIKMQNKMIKIQTGKIQKISQRDSKKECNVQQLEEIKKNLFQVTHLFDEPLQDFQQFRPIDCDNKPLAKKAKTFNNLALAEHRHPRLSNLKPQDYLKNEYFNEYNNGSKSRTRFSLKDLDLTKQDSNKENPLFMTNTNFAKKPQHVRLLLNDLD